MIDLTPNQLAIVKLLSDGHDTGSIMEELSFGRSTIDNSLSNIMTKKEATNRTHLIAICIRDGTID